MSTLSEIGAKFFEAYNSPSRTTKRMKLIDVYLCFILLTGVLQFAYCAMVGTFPFNSFLSGFLCTVGCFVLTVGLRMQVNPANKDFYGRSPERAFADYAFCNLVLFLVVMNFMG